MMICAMFDGLYKKMMSAARHKHALSIYLLFTFLESFIFPFAPDPMMLPMISSNRKLLWKLPWMSTLVSVLGGVVGYFIGYYSFEFFGQKILSFYQMQSSYDAFVQTFQHYGFWIISLKGLTPIPFKVLSLSAGMAHFDLKLFILTSCIARLSRFYLIAFMIWYMGDNFQIYLKKYFPLYLLLTLITFSAGFGLLKLLHF